MINKHRYAMIKRQTRSIAPMINILHLHVYESAKTAMTSKDYFTLEYFKTFGTCTTSCSQIWEHYRSSRSEEPRLVP